MTKKRPLTESKNITTLDRETRKCLSIWFRRQLSEFMSKMLSNCCQIEIILEGGCFW